MVSQNICVLGAPTHHHAGKERNKLPEPVISIVPLLDRTIKIVGYHLWGLQREHTTILPITAQNVCETVPHVD